MVGYVWKVCMRETHMSLRFDRVMPSITFFLHQFTSAFWLPSVSAPVYGAMLPAYTWLLERLGLHGVLTRIRGLNLVL